MDCLAHGQPPKIKKPAATCGWKTYAREGRLQHKRGHNVTDTAPTRTAPCASMEANRQGTLQHLTVQIPFTEEEAALALNG